MSGIFTSAASAFSGMLSGLFIGRSRNDRIATKRKSGRFNPYASPHVAAAGGAILGPAFAYGIHAPTPGPIRPALSEPLKQIQPVLVKPVPVKASVTHCALACPAVAPRPATNALANVAPKVEFVVPQSRPANSRVSRPAAVRGALKPSSVASASVFAGASSAVAVAPHVQQQQPVLPVPSPTVSETLPLRRKRPARLSDPPDSGLAPMDTIMYASELIQEGTQALRELSAGAGAPSTAGLRALLARLHAADTQLLQLRVETRHQAAMRVSASEEIGGLICTLQDAVGCLERRAARAVVGITPAPAASASCTPMDISVGAQAPAAGPALAPERRSFGSTTGRLSFASSAGAAQARRPPARRRESDWAQARDSVGSLATSVGPSASAAGTPAASDLASTAALAAELRAVRGQVAALQAALDQSGAAASPRRLVQAAAARIGGWLGAHA